MEAFPNWSLGTRMGQNCRAAVFAAISFWRPRWPPYNLLGTLAGRVLLAFYRKESVVEDVVCHLFSLCDASRLVEAPMDAEINPALTILFFRL
jgi:hypothetical protein